MLSGFLIGGILIDSREATNFWSVFYTRRSSRILPLYAVMLGAFFAGSALLDIPWLFGNPLPAVSYITFTQNFAMAWASDFSANWVGPTWSLAVEEQFYLLLPIIVRFIEPKRLPWALIALIIAAPAFRFGVYHWFSKEHLLAVYTLMPCRADALLLGALGAWLIRSRHVRIIQTAAFHWLFLLLLSGVIVGAYGFDSYLSRGMFLFGYSIIALFYVSALLIAATDKSGVVCRITSNRTLRYLGTIAYGTYLLHIPLVGLLHGIVLHQAPTIKNVADLAVTALALFATIAIAHLSLRYLERPITNWGRSRRYSAVTPLTNPGTSSGISAH